MSHLGYLIQDAWEKLLALPFEFWLVSPVITFAISVFACVIWSLLSFLMPLFIFNRKVFFKYIPILWVSFEFFAISIATNNDVFFFIGAIIFAFYGLLINLKQSEIPRH